MTQRARGIRRTTAPRRGSGAERGSQTIEALLILPVLFGIFFVIIQGAVWVHAGNIAQAAASSAYNAARLFEATPDDGIAAGNATATGSGMVLSGAVVTVGRTPTEVSVTVTGNAPTLVPGWNTAVERSVTGPVERWIG
ncbi:TadE family protein [Cryobacterium melibiosiphilum]|uniref:TadE family protein n=1 Tax=Cryobacterium melibiosiphilum TaxID=995039 RepID=UPI001314A13B|nr:TadE family protein [Cryobacterium melibiosiphilum]